MKSSYISQKVRWSRKHSPYSCFRKKPQTCLIGYQKQYSPTYSGLICCCLALDDGCLHQNAVLEIQSEKEQLPWAECKGEQHVAVSPSRVCSGAICVAIVTGHLEPVLMKKWYFVYVMNVLAYKTWTGAVQWLGFFFPHNFSRCRRYLCSICMAFIWLSLILHMWFSVYRYICMHCLGLTMQSFIPVFQV